jgi:hypothetical protein
MQASINCISQLGAQTCMPWSPYTTRHHIYTYQGTARQADSNPHSHPTAIPLPCDFALCPDPFILVRTSYLAAILCRFDIFFFGCSLSPNFFSSPLHRPLSCAVHPSSSHQAEHS